MDGVARDDPELVLEYRYADGKWWQPTYTVRLVNRWHKPLYCAIFGLWESFAVDPSFFPAGGVWLNPGEEVRTRLTYASVPDALRETGITERRDILKLIASTVEFDATRASQEALDTPPARDASQPRNAPVTTLDRLFSRLQTREGSSQPDQENYEDWVTCQLVITVRRPRDLVAVPSQGPGIIMGTGVKLMPHPRLVAQARLTSAPVAARDLGIQLLPPILQEGSRPLALCASRGADPGLSILELSQVSDYSVVTPRDPLRLRIAQSLAADEHVLPVGFDGEFYLPLGRVRRTDDGVEVLLERLSAPVSMGTRDLGGAIRILLQKLVARPLGLEYPYPILSAVTVGEDGGLSYEAEVRELQARVAAAQRITLFVHGLFGDSRDLLATAPQYDSSDLRLAYDYESINTPIEELARSLGQRLTAVGLGPDHHKELRVVGHSVGGLLARWFIEREGGDKIVNRLICLGTPHGGIPWATLEQWATLGIGLILNNLSVLTWPLRVLGLLVGAVESVDVTLDQIQPGLGTPQGPGAQRRPARALHASCR